MNPPDDVTLIEQFVSARAILTTNQNLKIEPVLGTNRLLTKTGELLATIDLTTKPTIVDVRQGCDYWILLHQALSDRGFMIIGLSSQPGLMRYEAHLIPVGYKMHCAEAKSLWEIWSDRVKSFNCRDIRLDILLFDRGAWYPIQEVGCQRGVVSIQTLITTLNLQDGDYVTWLKQLAVSRA